MSKKAENRVSERCMYTQLHSSTIYNSQKVEDFPGSRMDGICLPKQGTWVRSLVWEDSMQRGTTKPVQGLPWTPRAQAPEPSSCNNCLHAESPSSTTREDATVRSLNTAIREWLLLATTRESPCKPSAMKIQRSQN